MSALLARADVEEPASDLTNFVAAHALPKVAIIDAKLEMEMGARTATVDS